MSLQAHFKIKQILKDHFENPQLEWGQRDCITLFCQIQEQLWGTKTADAYLNKYNTERAARSWARNLGGEQFVQNTFLRDYELKTVGVQDLENGDGLFTWENQMPHAQTYYQGLWWTVTKDGFQHQGPHQEQYAVWRNTCHH